MDKFFEELAKIIEKYSGIVLNLGIGTFIITFLLFLLVFVFVIKNLWDEEHKWWK